MASLGMANVLCYCSLCFENIEHFPSYLQQYILEISTGSTLTSIVSLAGTTLYSQHVLRRSWHFDFAGQFLWSGCVVGVLSLPTSFPVSFYSILPCCFLRLLPAVEHVVKQSACKNFRISSSTFRSPKLSLFLRRQPFVQGAIYYDDLLHNPTSSYSS